MRSIIVGDISFVLVRYAAANRLDLSDCHHSATGQLVDQKSGRKHPERNLWNQDLLALLCSVCFFALGRALMSGVCGPSALLVVGFVRHFSRVAAASSLPSCALSEHGKRSSCNTLGCVLASRRSCVSPR